MKSFLSCAIVVDGLSSRTWGLYRLGAMMMSMLDTRLLQRVGETKD